MLFNEALLDPFITYTAYLGRLSTTELATVYIALLDLQEELVKLLRDNEAISGYKRKRVESLIAQAQDTIDATYTSIADSNATFNANVARLSAKQTKRTFTNLLLPIQSVITTDEQYKALASNALINGAPSKEWWSKQSSNLRDAFAQQVRIGYISGESIDDIVRRIRGKTTGKRFEYTVNGKTKLYVDFTGGILDTSTRQASALVRSSVQQVSADAKMATFKANKHLIKAVMWVATLDSRTTLLCATRDSKLYDLDGAPIGHDLPNLGFPPAHWNCRSTLVPITKSWQELTGEDLELYEDVPSGTRASLDGEVPETKSFTEWFATKPTQFQREYLGDKRYALYKDNNVSLSDMVRGDGKPLTLTQLETLI